MKKELVFLLCTSCFTLPAHAGETMFSRAYTTDTVPEGHFEIEQLARFRDQRSMGTYNALDLRSELEYGLSNKLQAALYVNSGYIHAKGAPDDDDPNGATGFDRTKWFLQGISAEFIYRVMSPYTDPFGLAFYIEPEYQFTDLHNGLAYNHTFGIEYRAIFQKNFLDDRLIFVYNLVLETEAISFKDDPTYNSELDWNNEIGVSYRFMPNWFAGLEGRNHNEYGNFNTHEHSVFWVGPVLHYGGPKMWATLGWLEQVYGSPSGIDENGTFIGHDLFLRSHERHEITFKVGIPF